MSDVIIACDFNSRLELFEFLNKFGNVKPFIKIGMELYYKEGYELVKKLKSNGYKIFLDLKLCDIPNTVYKAMLVLKNLNIDFINVHVFGGVEMMKAAKKAFIDTNTKVIGVTIMTSIDEYMLKNELCINLPLVETVSSYIENVKSAGLDGIVCSVYEANIVKEKGLISITPGIRYEDNDKGDQKRVSTPMLAKKLGSDYIVVGRPITQSKDPLTTYLKFKEDFI